LSEVRSFGLMPTVGRMESRGRDMAQNPVVPPGGDGDDLGAGHLVTLRGFMIIAIAFPVGLLAGAVSFATVEPQAGPVMGVAAGLVALATTSLLIAGSLHKLLPMR
jgi:hypothetical protein